MGTTPSYGWVFPDPTDLVKDLPADFELFADAVDADLADLLGGASGTILSKASASDHDFSWIAPSGLISIASGTLSGSAVNITSIPTTYKDLVLVVNQATTSATDKVIRLRFNADTGANYVDLGSWSVTTNNATSATEIVIGYYSTGTSREVIYVEIPDYADTGSWKTAWRRSINTHLNNTANVDIRATVGVWDSASAINEVNIVPESGTFSSGSYVLYGRN